MTNTAKNSIKIPEKTEVSIEGDKVSVKGSKGVLAIVAHPDVLVTQENGYILFQKAHKDAAKAFIGLTRALIANMVKGVNQEFTKKLELEGVGYRVALTGNKLVMQLGFSHPVEVEMPEGITFKVEKNAIFVTGIDKGLVGQTAANIRKLKKPEPYKGKGIHYEGEVIRRKEGKRAGTAA